MLTSAAGAAVARWRGRGAVVLGQPTPAVPTRRPYLVVPVVLLSFRFGTTRTINRVSVHRQRGQGSDTGFYQEESPSPSIDNRCCCSSAAEERDDDAAAALRDHLGSGRRLTTKMFSFPENPVLKKVLTVYPC